MTAFHRGIYRLQIVFKRGLPLKKPTTSFLLRLSFDVRKLKFFLSAFCAVRRVTLLASVPVAAAFGSIIRFCRTTAVFFAASVLFAAKHFVLIASIISHN